MLLLKRNTSQFKIEINPLLGFMELSRIPKRSDVYGRYYTDKFVANLLVGAVTSARPNLVIDLGCGNGALIEQARKQWKRSTFVTADIDDYAKEHILQKNPVEGVCHHHVIDVLGNAIDQRIGINFGTVDVALCNPPYVRPKWKKHFGEILEDAGLSHIIPKIGCVPAEVLFIAQNLRFLRPKGKLGLILPDGIVSGEKSFHLRQFLTTSHRLERVIELPRRIFQNTDAKAHILILGKEEQARDVIKVQSASMNGVLSPAIMLSTKDAAKRIDFSYLVGQNLVPNCISLETLGTYTLFAKRGIYSSTDRQKCNFPVLHTTDFEAGISKVPKKFIVGRSIVKSVTGVVAQAGDILIARVGRNLANKVIVVPRGYVVISDCVIALRVVPEQRDRILAFLLSEHGKAALNSISHGVGACFVTIQGILSIKLV